MCNASKPTEVTMLTVSRRIRNNLNAFGLVFHRAKLRRTKAHIVIELGDLVNHADFLHRRLLADHLHVVEREAPYTDADLLRPPPESLFVQLEELQRSVTTADAKQAIHEVIALIRTMGENTRATFGSSTDDETADLFRDTLYPTVKDPK